MSWSCIFLDRVFLWKQAKTRHKITEMMQNVESSNHRGNHKECLSEIFLSVCLPPSFCLSVCARACVCACVCVHVIVETSKDEIQHHQNYAKCDDFRTYRQTERLLLWSDDVRVCSRTPQLVQMMTTMTITENVSVRARASRQRLNGMQIRFKNPKKKRKPQEQIQKPTVADQEFRNTPV